MSVRLSFDNEHCAYNLVCCSYIQQHGFAKVWCSQDWVAGQEGLYFFQSGCSRIRPLEVFGASKKAIKKQCLFSQSGDKVA